MVIESSSGNLGIGLAQACRCLGLCEHLCDLHGVDLEIERLRVEGELQAAGLVLPSVTGECPER